MSAVDRALRAPQLDINWDIQSFVVHWIVQIQG